MSHLVFGAQVLLTVVFAVASWSKFHSVTAFQQFVESIKDLRLAPAGIARPAAVCIGLAEAAVVVLLSVPRTQSAGFGLSAALLAVFTFAVAIAVFMRRTARCHCFGAAQGPLRRDHLYRNLGLLAASLTGYALVAERNWGDQLPVSVASACFAVGAAILAIRWDDLHFIIQAPSGVDHG